MFTNVNYETEDVARIDVVFADGETEIFERKTSEDSGELQNRVDNMHRVNFDDDVLEAVLAYNYDGEFLAARTPMEFFGAQEGF